MKHKKPSERNLNRIRKYFIFCSVTASLSFLLILNQALTTGEYEMLYHFSITSMCTAAFMFALYAEIIKNLKMLLLSLKTTTLSIVLIFLIVLARFFYAEVFSLYETIIGLLYTAILLGFVFPRLMKVMQMLRKKPELSDETI